MTLGTVFYDHFWKIDSRNLNNQVFDRTGLQPLASVFPPPRVLLRWQTNDIPRLREALLIFQKTILDKSVVFLFITYFFNHSGASFKYFLFTLINFTCNLRNLNLIKHRKRRARNTLESSSGNSSMYKSEGFSGTVQISLIISGEILGTDKGNSPSIIRSNN